LVILAFHTKKGAVVYSAGGSVNCDDSVVKSGTLTSLIRFFLHDRINVKPAAIDKIIIAFLKPENFMGIDFLVIVCRDTPWRIPIDFF
jgi:hypothetical protein